MTMYSLLRVRNAYLWGPQPSQPIHVYICLPSLYQRALTHRRAAAAALLQRKRAQANEYVPQVDDERMVHALEHLRCAGGPLPP